MYQAKDTDKPLGALVVIENWVESTYEFLFLILS